MRITGTGITAFTCKLKPGFTPRTELALKWQRTADGNWYATDRGAASDYYETDVQIVGRYDILKNFLTEVYDNREAHSNVITLDGFFDNERIFGADVVTATSFTATILKISPFTQKSLGVYGVQMSLRCLNPTFIGTAQLPLLHFLQTGYSADVSEWRINKYDTYTGTYSYLDSFADSGKFTGTFLFSQTDMADFRRYWATQRAAEIEIGNIQGVPLPFGPNRPITYPFDCRILSIDSEQMRDLKYWTCKVTFVESV